MPSSLIRGRPKRARALIWVRVVQTVLGGVVGVLWLALPAATADHGISPDPAAEGHTSATDLVLPVAAAVVVCALAAYGYLRRVRRARLRTTPASAGTRHVGAYVTPAPPPPLADLDTTAQTSLITADNLLRALHDELAFAPDEANPAAAAAAEELSTAFAIRHRYDEGVPAEEESRRHALAGIVGRCAEVRRLVEGAEEGRGRQAPEAECLGQRHVPETEGAGQRLAPEAAGPSQRPAPEAPPAPRRTPHTSGDRFEQRPLPALALAETRFRELTARTPTVETLYATLLDRYSPSATDEITGYPELAKDQLVTATTELNRAHQDPSRLRPARSAIVRASVLLAAVPRLAAVLQEATALTAAPGGDPLEALRTADDAPARGALLAARESVAAAEDFIAVHREAVTAPPRTLLAAARELLATDTARADELAQESRARAEQDVRLRGAAPETPEPLRTDSTTPPPDQ